MWMCFCMGICYMCVQGGQKRALHPMELELQVVVSQKIRVLGTELRSSARAVSAVKGRSSSPALPELLRCIYIYILSFSCV